jgi:NAD(P)-dependent dehydrogenase (short-subunit alcohol dehydrogenase family)
MLAAGGGSIINSSSVLGILGAVHESAYVTSQHAVIGLTRGAATDYAARGIRVNVIVPGPVATAPGSNPAGRSAQPGEIASVVLWLASDLASYVTGAAITVDAASGLGQSTARAFAASGAKVVVSDINEAAGRETVASLGGDALFVRADVADPDNMQEVVNLTLARFGRLDIAYNNAGIELTPNPLAEQSIEEFDRVIAVNVLGVFNSMRAEIPAMLTSGGGAIINASSGLGLRAIPMQSPYVASKHAVLGLTKAAALEYAALGIRINAVAIGVIDSPLYETAAATTPGYKERIWSRQPNGRIGTMDVVADTVMWLASGASSYVVGASIVLDGEQAVT